jgi:hypothetical protein
MEHPIGQYCIVRTESAGVFAAVVDQVEGDVVKLSHSRRLWYWRGAASLSELATRGTSRPSECKFPASVPSMVIRDWIELIPVSEEAKASIAAVPVWTA